MSKKAKRRGKILCCILLVLLAIYGGAEFGLFDNPNQKVVEALHEEKHPCVIERAQVVRVIDGDTLLVSLFGEEQTVRLIGCNTPESVHPNEKFNNQEGEDASNHTKALVKEGATIWLEKDVSEQDSYGRLLRYVWLEKPTSTHSELEVRTKMLNAMLIEQGYADAKSYEPDVRWESLFKSLEK